MKKLIGFLTILFISINIAYPQDILYPEPELADQDIADAIEDEYSFDHAINVNKIDVNVIDGIVELSGAVDNIKAKERAGHIAQLIKGVRSVSNRVVVDPPVTLADADIRSGIENAILMDPATYLFEVNIAVDNGVVTLTGTVDSYQKKVLCGNIAKSVKGVIELKNEIGIEYKYRRTDREIENEIEQALKWNAFVRDNLIDVNVQDGTVKLSGMVGSSAEKEEAYHTAWITGVNSVDNEDLEVRWWLRNFNLQSDRDITLTDLEIEQAIRDATLYDPRLFSFNITPESNNGLVTLRGTVENVRARKVAENLAKNTTGVIKVTNRIKVRMSDPPTDPEIKANIQTALLNNVLTEPADIHVKVNNGEITLSGDVDSYLEKNEAEKVTSNIRGVNEVYNYITVELPFSYYSLDNYPYYELYLNPPVLKDIPVTAFPDDNEIKESINNNLFWSPFVDSEQITIEVENGKVILEGTVESWLEYQKAAENAWKGGALALTNKLIVNETPLIDQSEIPTK